MALTRPTLLSQVAFDATQKQTFSFIITGVSSQIVANQLTIRKQDTNDIVYQEKQETFQYNHIVNADELTNGTYYTATISVFDVNNNQSPESIPIQFWCYSTPELTFTNIPTNGIVTNASFTFEFQYIQAQNEPINSYVMNLFNSSQVQISTSGVQYTDDGTTPFTGNYIFTGFENNTVYYIQLIATTIEGTIVKTNLQQFTVQYSRPDLFTLVQLVNNCDEGYITLTSNIVLIEGESNPNPPVYINNQEIDLTSSGSWVQWGQGFSITGDMLARAWFRNPNEYSTLIQFSNTQGQTIKLNFMLGYESSDSTSLQAYVEAYVESFDGAPYYVFSNYVNQLTSTQDYVLYLNRINNIYSLQLLTS